MESVDKFISTIHTWLKEEILTKTARTLEAEDGKGKHFQDIMENQQHHPTTVEEVRKIAHEKFTDNARLYYESGADGEQTLQENSQAYDRLRLWRCLPTRDYGNDADSVIDLSVDLLGKKLDIPICVAPTAMHMMADDEGEVATARAAQNCGTCMCVSILGTVPYEDIAKSVPRGTYWMQLSIYNCREMTKEFIRTADAAGYKAVVLTVDAPVLGHRIADEKYKMKLPNHLSLKNFEGKIPNQLGTASGSALAAFINGNKERNLDWDIVAWVKSVTSMPVLLKGILTHEDAELCLKYNVDGILVSNHGARQLDGGPATIEALPEVVRAVQGKIPVFVDGGIRKGSDVFKALALGAKAVFVGRPVIYGLAYNGSHGVDDVLNILTKELKQTMKFSGCRSVKDINAGMVVHESAFNLNTSSLKENVNWTATPDIIKCVADIKESAKQKFTNGQEFAKLSSDDTIMFQRFRIRPRMLRGIQSVDPTVDVFGDRMKFPVIAVMPVNLLNGHNVISMDPSSVSEVVTNLGIDVVAPWPVSEKYSSLPCFIEISNCKLNESIMQQAEKAGYKGIIVQNDGTLLNNRIISSAIIPVIVKGVYIREDVMYLLKLNVKGIIVCDGSTVPSINVLSQVVDAVKGCVPVFYESNITKGTDIFKAIGLGAKAVLIKSPVSWGVLHQRAEGMKLVLQILKEEFIRTMYLAGAANVDQIVPSMVVEESYYWNVGKSVSRL